MPRALEITWAGLKLLLPQSAQADAQALKVSDGLSLKQPEF